MQTKLEKEIAEHLQLIDATTRLTSRQARWKCALVDNEDRRNPSPFRNRTGRSVNTQPPSWVVSRLNCRRKLLAQHAQTQSASLLEIQGALEQQLNTRQLSEQTLHRSQQELESVIQSQAARLGPHRD